MTEITASYETYHACGINLQVMTKQRRWNAGLSTVCFRPQKRCKNLVPLIARRKHMMRDETAMETRLETAEDSHKNKYGAKALPN